MKIIKTEKAPAAIGPYSQGVVASPGQLIFTAGQIPIDPKTGEIVKGGIKEQTRQSLENVKAVLSAGGVGLENVVKVTVFLKDMNEFQDMNAVYAEYFSGNPPARAAVEVTRLPKDVRVEIEAIAILE